MDRQIEKALDASLHEYGLASNQAIEDFQTQIKLLLIQKILTWKKLPFWMKRLMIIPISKSLERFILIFY
jgi:hypothetical protein